MWPRLGCEGRYRPAMRRALAAVQVAGLLTSLGAMLAPDPVLLAKHWTSFTIYPWWSPLLVLAALGTAVAMLTTWADDPGRRAAAACATGVVAAQVGGLGLWAHKHWHPAFGIGGGYAGDMHELEGLAWVVAAGALLACLASIVQLVVHRDWPRRDTSSSWRRVVLGLVVMAGLPVLLAVGDRDQMDATSLGALALVFGIPWGGAVVAGRWLSSTAYSAVLGTCAVSAVLAGLHSSDEITHHRGGLVFLGAAAVFVLVLYLERRDGLAERGPDGDPGVAAGD